MEDSFTFSPLIGVVGVMQDKDYEGVLAAFEPMFAEVVVTQNGTLRAMPAEQLAEVACGIFGSDRVLVRRTLEDAIDKATGLAEEGGHFGVSCQRSPLFPPAQILASARPSPDCHTRWKDARPRSRGSRQGGVVLKAFLARMCEDRCRPTTRRHCVPLVRSRGRLGGRTPDRSVPCPLGPMRGWPSGS